MNLLLTQNWAPPSRVDETCVSLAPSITWASQVRSISASDQAFCATKIGRRNSGVRCHRRFLVSVGKVEVEGRENFFCWFSFLVERVFLCTSYCIRYFVNISYSLNMTDDLKFGLTVYTTVTKAKVSFMERFPEKNPSLKCQHPRVCQGLSWGPNFYDEMFRLSRGCSKEMDNCRCLYIVMNCDMLICYDYNYD